MKDIENIEDIKLLIDRFYKKVVLDPVIGHFFTTVVNLSWEKHIPIMHSFWESVLFGTGSYSGNPMIKHIDLNRMSPLEQQHFERWLELWKETVNENFSGKKADEAIKKAGSIAQLMQFKISSKFG